MFNLFTCTVSFDVESLFTNLPLNECIDLAVKYISEGNPGLKLSENELKRLFGFATNESHFPFKGKLYDQMDSVAMGYPSLRVVYKFSCATVMLVMLVKSATVSPHACVSTYFRTDLLTSLGICRVQSLVEHQVYRIFSRS